MAVRSQVRARRSRCGDLGRRFRADRGSGTRAEERGRVMGLVMSGTTVGLFMIGPSLGGWLYESAGPQVPTSSSQHCLPYAPSGSPGCRRPATRRPPSRSGSWRCCASTRLLVCAAAVVLGGGTLAMIEPTLSLFLGDQIGLGPTRIGLGDRVRCGGVGRVASGIRSDRRSRRRTPPDDRRACRDGRDAAGAVDDFEFHERGGHYAGKAVSIVMMVTPSLAYMADATSGSGAFVRRRLRRVQLRLGARPARGALRRRGRVRARRVRRADVDLGCRAAADHTFARSIGSGPHGACCGVEFGRR